MAGQALAHRLVLGPEMWVRQVAGEGRGEGAAGAAHAHGVVSAQPAGHLAGRGPVAASLAARLAAPGAGGRG